MGRDEDVSSDQISPIEVVSSVTSFIGRDSFVFRNVFMISLTS